MKAFRAIAVLLGMLSSWPALAAQALGGTPEAYLATLNSLFSAGESPGIKIEAGHCGGGPPLLACDIRLNGARSIDLRLGINGTTLQSVGMILLNGQPGTLLASVDATASAFAADVPAKERGYKMMRLIEILNSGAVMAIVEVGAIEIRLARSGGSMVATISRP